MQKLYVDFQNFGIDKFYRIEYDKQVVSEC